MTMTAMEAFKVFFGVDSVPREQEGMALGGERRAEYAGNHDEETIKSIPKQAERLWVRLFRLLGRRPTQEEVMGDIDLRAWESKNGRGTDNAKNGKWSRAVDPSRDQLESALAESLQLMIDAHYVKLFNRPPDPEGNAYWLDDLAETVQKVLHDRLVMGALGEDAEKVKMLRAEIEKRT